MDFAQLTYRESLRGSIPCFVHVSPGPLHDINVLDRLLIEPAAFYVMDRAYLDYR